MSAGFNGFRLSGSTDIELMVIDEHSNSRSPYRLTTSERMRGVANRIMFSRYYIIFYLVMTGLSLGTVILSLLEGGSQLFVSDVIPVLTAFLDDLLGGCPSTTWHILEIIVNGGMVLEVGTRWVGFGKVSGSVHDVSVRSRAHISRLDCSNTP